MSRIVNCIDGEGTFHGEELEEFLSDISLAECKADYHVVAIMGPQSSGKSTMLNHLFGTDFQMMDAEHGRKQTTKGIWLSKAVKVTEMMTLVMDLEGSDGRERGEDDTNFERQSALFALATADVLLVNIWCHDIGREQGSGKPLLKTIFQVNLKLFAPEPNRRKTVLLFVIRDKSRTPVPKLVEVLEEDLRKMWDTISKPAQYKDSKMSDFFDVEYAALSNFEEKFEEFTGDVSMLRTRFVPDAEGTLVRTGTKLPGAAFALSAMEMWKVIRSQKDLNLPAHKIMVSSIRCQQIKAEQLRAFATDQAWEGLAAEAREQLVPQFGERAQGLVESCLKGYEADANYFDVKECAEKRAELMTALMALLQPVWNGQVAMLQARTMGSLEKELKTALAQEPTAWAAAARECSASALESFNSWIAQHLQIATFGLTGEAACRDTQAAVASYLAATKAKLVGEELKAAERGLTSSLVAPLISLLDNMPPGVWSAIHKVCRESAETAARQLLSKLTGFKLALEECTSTSARLNEVAFERCEAMVREASLTRLSRMKDRFTQVFTLTKNHTPRTWNGKENVPMIAQQAREAAAHVLAMLAVLRAPGEEGHDLVEEAVLRLARFELSSSASSTSANGISSSIDPVTGFDILSAASWPGVPPERVLQQPHEIRTTWRDFLSWSNTLVSQAQNTQHANQLAANRPPPLWAIAAMVVLGWNELMSLLSSPMMLITIALLVLFLRTLYVEVDFEREMQSGVLPGVISISGKILPASQKVVSDTFKAVAKLINSPEGAAREAPYRVEETSNSTSSGASTSAQVYPSQSGVTSRRPHQAQGEVELTSL